MPPVHKLGGASVVALALAIAAHAQAQGVSPRASQPSETANGSQAATIPAISAPYEDGQARHDRAMRDPTRRYYPQAAQKAGVSGKAVLDCFVDAEGWLRDCTVASEEPSGFGFGEAALRMVPLFHMNKDKAGARTQIPLTFKLPK